MCYECKHTFEEPKYWKETHGLDFGPYEKICGCPKCGGAYADSQKCDCCGNLIEGVYVITDDGNRYCEDCYHVAEFGEEE